MTIYVYICHNIVVYVCICALLNKLGRLNPKP